MKFQCDQCGTRYTLSDEKIRNKVLKIRCKVCENIMVVRDPNARRNRPVLQTPAPVQNDRTQLSEPLGAAFDAEWYVAAAGMQQGPMPVERLIADLRRGAVGPDDLVWNATMDEWQPAHSLPILAGGIGAASPQLPPLVPSGSDDEEATVIQNAPSLFDLGPRLKPAGDRLASEVSAAVNAIHPVDAPAPDEVDTTLWPALPNEPLDPVDTATFEPAAPKPESSKPESSKPESSKPESSKPAMPSPELSEAPPIPDFSTQAPAAPVDSTPVPVSPATGDGAEGDQASWMASLTDHLEDAPEAAAAVQIHAITKTAPKQKAKAPLVVLILLLLAGVAAAIFWPKGAALVGPDQGVADAAAPVVDAAAPDAAPDAAPKPVDATVDAVVDAAVPDAAKPKRRKAPASKPKRPRTPKTDASKTRRKPRSGLAALDKGKGSSNVELNTTIAPIEILPETLTKGQLQVVLTRGRTGVQACYQRQLKRDPSMKGGKVTIKFSVQRNGRSKKVRMERQYDGSVLKTCISSLVRRWRFPRFTGEPIPVEYPVFFQRAM